MNATERLERSRTVTRPITSKDMGKRTEELDLAIRFDVVTRSYFYR